MLATGRTNKRRQQQPPTHTRESANVVDGGRNYQVNGGTAPLPLLIRSCPTNSPFRPAYFFPPVAFCRPAAFFLTASTAGPWRRGQGRPSLPRHCRRRRRRLHGPGKTPTAIPDIAAPPPHVRRNPLPPISSPPLRARVSQPPQPAYSSRYTFSFYALQHGAVPPCRGAPTRALRCGQ